MNERKRKQQSEKRMINFTFLFLQDVDMLITPVFGSITATTSRALSMLLHRLHHLETI